jgi:hypothetical protein
MRYWPSARRIGACLVARYGLKAAIELAKAWGLEQVVEVLQDWLNDEGSRQREPAPPIPR